MTMTSRQATVHGWAALVRRQLRANRVSLAVLTVLVTIVNVVQVQGYVSLFPNASVRDALLAPFANNAGLRVFCGYPFDIGDATGWVAWRSMSTGEVIMAVWAIMILSGAARRRGRGTRRTDRQPAATTPTVVRRGPGEH